MFLSEISYNIAAETLETLPGHVRKETLLVEKRRFWDTFKVC